MDKEKAGLTRRDFVKGVSLAAVGSTVRIPEAAAEGTPGGNMAPTPPEASKRPLRSRATAQRFAREVSPPPCCHRTHEALPTRERKPVLFRSGPEDVQR